MTGLTTWAQRWQIPAAAIHDLLVTLGAAVPLQPPTGVPATSEQATQVARVLRAARMGHRLWRNNSGACEDATGRQIRYGLGNTSSQVNKVMKSSDLIGVTSVIVSPAMVGQRVAIFTAEECKAPTWRYRESDERAKAQLNFGKLVISLGGIFRFVTHPEQED